MTGKDPLRYFRIEARELADQVSSGVLELPRDRPDPRGVAALLRHAHTLKGAARVVRQHDIAETAHSLEEALLPFRDGTEPVPQGAAAELLALADRLATLVSALHAPAPPATGASAAPEAPAATHAEPAARPDSADIDELLEAVGEAHARFAPLRRQVGTVEHARRTAETLTEHLRHRDSDPRARAAAGRLAGDLTAIGRQLTATVEQVERELDDIRGRAERLRLVPVTGLLASLHRAVFDAAAAEGKQVLFTGSGSDLRVDPQVLSLAAGALLHVVRNAVAHGVERPADRLAAGKPADGCVEVEVLRRGTDAVFRCRDDGRGFDLAAVRAQAETRGLVRGGATADVRELIGLLMRGGISTADRVTGISGRGIGLDAVRDVAERLGGAVEVSTEPGLGSTVELVVPMSLASLPGLVVEAAGTVAALPLDAVLTCVLLGGAHAAAAAAAGALPYDGRVLPFVPLGRALGGPAGESTPVAVVVYTDERTVAVGVQRLLGTSALVVRPLPELAPAAAVVSGLSIDGEGNPRLVLDPRGLAAAAGTSNAPLVVEEFTGQEVRPAPVLVVDDSLTTRMLERSILESAGYDVELAASAEEALERVRHRRHALYLVDVDMPGLDGFTFVERTRADPQPVPAILVSSRSSAEDRRRAQEAGASAYMVKSEFDQDQLLSWIRDLAGAP